MNLNQLGLIETDDPEVYAGRMRYQRDLLLAASDWTQVADAPVDREAWAAYRQALRDFPATWTPGPIADFPLAPGEEPAAVESDTSEQSAEVPVEEGPSDDLSDSSSSPDPG